MPALYLGGGGYGSKPEALRTEYAEDGEYDGSYHGDIVFYLQRAGEGGGGEDGGNGLEDSMNKEGLNKNAIDDYPQSIIPNFGVLDTVNGVFNEVDYVLGGAQSVWNQVGMIYWDDGYNDDYDSSGSAGGGADYDWEVPPGAISPNGVLRDQLREALRNAFQDVDSLEDAYIKLSESSSEFFFTELLNQSFSVGEEEDILGSIEKAPRAELAVQLARASGGVTSTRDLVEGINNGTRGLTTIGSKATAALLSGNTGRTFRSLKK